MLHPILRSAQDDGAADYVFCVVTRDQPDESWRPDNEGYVLLRRVSALLWLTSSRGTRGRRRPGPKSSNPELR